MPSDGERPNLAPTGRHVPGLVRSSFSAHLGVVERGWRGPELLKRDPGS